MSLVWSTGRTEVTIIKIKIIGRAMWRAWEKQRENYVGYKTLDKEQ